MFSSVKKSKAFIISLRSSVGLTASFISKPLVLALFVCEQFLGFWGVILSPAIASTVCVLIDELYIKPINEKTEQLKAENE